MILRINDHELPLFEHQQRFMNLQCRNPGLFGGLGSGKSRVAIIKALAGAHENPGLIGLYACLTYPLLRDAILPELYSILNDYDLQEGVDWELNQGAMSLTLWTARNANGTPATILFRPVDGKKNLAKMIAVTAAWAVLDEAGSMTDEAQRRVSERVRDGRSVNPFVASVSTPEGLNWLYDEYVSEPRKRAAAAGLTSGTTPDEQYRYVRGRTRDNTSLDPGYINALLARYPDHLVEAYLEGYFVPMFEGLCFRFSERDHVDLSAVYDPVLPICMAWDFNVNPMSVTLNHWHKGQLWTFDEIVLGTSHTEEVCQQFLSLYGGHSAGVRVYGDAAGRSGSTKAKWSDYQIIAHHLQGMPAYREHVDRANPSQRNSINEFDALLRNGHGHISYTIHPSCSETIKSLLTTKYDEKGGIYKDKADAYEHLTDGLRYIAHQVAPLELTLRKGAPTRRGRYA